MHLANNKHTSNNQHTYNKEPTSNKHHTWQLYGTLGCHLCDEAKNLLQQALMVKDFTYETIDIIDLPESQMQSLADKIPVLMTPNKTLYYPFSIMDIMQI